MRRTPKASHAADRPGAVAVERRAHVRYPVEIESSCSPLVVGQEMQWTGKICDLSQGGIGILLARRFELGTLLGIEIQESSGGSLGRRLARVVHVTPHSSGGWIVGCCFASELTEDEVKSLVQDAVL